MNEGQQTPPIEQVSDTEKDWKYHLTTMTLFSKTLAMLLFIMLPFWGFWLGMQQGTSIKSSEIVYTTDRQPLDLIDSYAAGVEQVATTKHEVVGESECPDGMVPVEGKLFENSPTCEEGTFVQEEISCANLVFWWHRTEERMAKLISGTSSTDADYTATLYSRTHGLRIVHIDGLEVASFSTLDLFSEDEIQDFFKVPMQQFVYGGKILGCSDGESVAWGVLYTHISADPPQPASHSVFKINLKNKAVEHFPLVAPYDSIRYNDKHNSFLYEHYPEGTWKSLYLSQAGPIEIRLFEPDIQQDRVLVAWSSTSVMQIQSAGDFMPTRRTPSPKWLTDTTIEYFDYDMGTTTKVVVY